MGRSILSCTFRELKAIALICALVWIVLIVFVHQRLVIQHKRMDNSVGAFRHRTKPMLTVICGNKTIEISDKGCLRRFDLIASLETPNPCFNQFGLDLTVPTKRCAILKYLIYVEKVCPEPEIDQIAFHDLIKVDSKSKLLQENRLARARCRDNLKDLLAKMEECGEVCSWMKTRVSNVQSHWLDAIGEIVEQKGMENSVTNRSGSGSPYVHRARLTVLLHMGLLTKEYGLNFGLGALAGGPLGELVQWSDLAASLELLGHDVVLSWSPERLAEIIKPSILHANSCDPQPKADLVFTDLVGLDQIQATLGTLYHYRCKVRVLDVYGTEPEFNHPRYLTNRKQGSWGGKGLDPKQFYTHFPHSPDNSFLGFAIREGKAEEETTNNDEQVLLYGKKTQSLNGKGKRVFLDILHKYFPKIHATMNVKPRKNAIDDENSLPDYVINHGPMKQDEFLQLLKSSRIYVGLGWPVEGPAALEAVANGVTYLNPRFSPPRDTHEGKPTSRLLSSQNPYAERFIGEPYVYTVDLRKTEAVEAILKKIKASPRQKPKVPREFSHFGFIERVNAYLENQEFCRGTIAVDAKTGSLWKREPRVWPNSDALIIKESTQGDSCTSTCKRHNLTCERQYFQLINNVDTFSKLSWDCATTEYIPERSNEKKAPNARDLCHAPSFDSLTGKCSLQTDTLLFSCACASPGGIRRACPCRAFMPEQIALCVGYT